MRIRTSSSQPKQGDPSWVEGFVRFTQCLFIFTSRGEVQCRLPILRSHPLVPRHKLVSVLFICFWFFTFFFFDTSNKPLNRSQTRRPDPFQVSAVTTRGLWLYSSGDRTLFYLRHSSHSKSKEYKNLLPGWKVSPPLNNDNKLLYLHNAIRATEASRA